MKTISFFHIGLMSKQPPVIITTKIIPQNPYSCFPEIIRPGDSFEIEIHFQCPHGSYNHRGIEFEFSSALVMEGAKPIQLSIPVLNVLQIQGTLPRDSDMKSPVLTIPKNVQTYHGENLNIRHICKVHVKKLLGSITHEKEVTSYEILPVTKSLKPMCVRVSVGENLRIDLMVNRRHYELADMMVGAAHFLEVKLKVKTFTVSLVAQEIYEIENKTKKHKNVIQCYEVTDGAPVKNEIIPFRLFLDPLKLTPSTNVPERGYSATHFIHFSIETVSGERYFKALQIKLSKWEDVPFIFVGEEAPSSE